MTSDGFRINISSKEASAEGRSTALLPRGDYHVKVTDGSIEECSPTAKNAGKPYYNLELTIQSGPHEGRKLYDNAMLFEGALYTIVQIMKALGHNVEEGEMIVPSLDEIIGQDFIVAVRKEPAKGDYDERNAVKSYMKYDPSKPLGGATAVAATTDRRSALRP
jgi:hypothetical protein